MSEGMTNYNMLEKVTLLNIIFEDNSYGICKETGINLVRNNDPTYAYLGLYITAKCLSL